MINESLEFASQGDLCVKKFASYLPEGSQPNRLLIEYRLNDEAFKKVQRACAEYVSTCLNLPQTEYDENKLIALFAQKKSSIINLTPNGMLVPKREHILEFNKIHRALAEALEILPQATEALDSIQVPLNFRIIDGEKNEVRDARPYATQKLHSDVWSGDPIDALIMHIPIFGDPEGLGVEFAEMPKEDELKFMKIFPDYNRGEEFDENLKFYENVKYQKGYACFADSRLLHRTKRIRQGVRMSIDMRIRMKSTGLFKKVSDEIIAPERVCNYVPLSTWNDMGVNHLLIFEESLAQAELRFSGKVPPSTLKHASNHKLINI
jgi:hypothetical protein